MAEPRARVVDVAVEVRSGGSQALWTYLAASDYPVGSALLVPLGPRAVIGYALGCRDVTEADLGFPLSQLRPPFDVIAGLDLPATLLEAVKFVAHRYLCPISVALGAATPPGARERIVSTWTLTDGATPFELTPMQAEVLATLRSQGGMIAETKTRRLPAATLRVLRLLETKGLVAHRREAVPLPPPKAEQGLLRLTPDTERVDEFLRREGKRKPAQALTLMRLQTAGCPMLSRDEIKALCGVTDQTLRALVTAGFLDVVKDAARTPKPPPQPNAHQASALRVICQALVDRQPKSFLLYGVTGSGKTEVFLRCAAEALRIGRQVLYLVPEIALATQAISQLKDRFGERVTILHSDLPPGRRLDHWLRVRNGAAPVVLGARSALFAPLDNIGLIIVDEEHEGSYKQDTSPRYHVKSVALKLAELHRCPVVFGSATPSIETFFEAQQGVHDLLELPVRAASARLPEVFLDDLRVGYRQHQPVVLAPELKARIMATLGRSEQTILFLNRRSYSPSLSCRDCGLAFKCPRCAVSLSFSRQLRLLRCHHCDYEEVPPCLCPKCGGTKLSPIGIGTEKVEEAVATDFPTARVARLDRDISRKKGALEDVLTRFRAGDIDILVGTQMVAKGLDFPNVTLVGVIIADVTLNLPDFRASERTFQLLSQVAGRAGRGSSPGSVVVQTFNPEHIALEAARDHDYQRLFQELIEERRLANYPPFCQLVNVHVSGEELTEVRTTSHHVAERLRSLSGVEVLGPVASAIEKLQNRWRRHVLVKLLPGADVAPVGTALADLKPKRVNIAIDVDPYSMM